MQTLKTLVDVIVWTNFVFAMIMFVVPTIIGILTKGLAGTIATVEDGKLWFYRHGLAYLLGAVCFVVALFAIKVRVVLG